MSEQSYIGKYLRHIENEVRIKHVFYQKDKKIEFRSLNGHEKLRIFQKINLKALLPDLDNIEDIHRLWSSFFDIYESIRRGNYDDKEAKADEIKKSTHDWFNLFIETYQDETITPYIHSFVEHLHELIRIHGDISLFTMQGKYFSHLNLNFYPFLHTHIKKGLEKLNDMTTNDYFKATNKSENFLEQLLNKRNRMEQMWLESLINTEQEMEVETALNN